MEDLFENKCKYLEHELEIEREHKAIVEQQLTNIIKDLKEQLKNAIVPKFKIGQEVWYIATLKGEKKLVLVTITNYVYYTEDNEFYYDVANEYLEILSESQNKIFATKAEAEQRLKELRGEIK